MVSNIDKLKFIFWSLPDHEKHKAEIVGDKGLYPITVWPKFTLNFISNPKVVVLGAGLIGAATWTYMNYPDRIIPLLTQLVKYLPNLPLEKIVEVGRASAWSTGVELIASLTARTYGRFAKESCMQQFWNSAGTQPLTSPRTKGAKS